MNTSESDTPALGTQSIGRAISLLRLLATRGRVGWGLVELATASGLKKATVHRILAGLERERLVHRRQAGDRYFLGPLLGELAMSVPGLQGFVREVQSLSTEFARETSLITIVAVRSGNHFVVLSRVKTSRLRGELYAEGARQPLISTAGGVAMMITYDRATQERIVATNRAEMLAMGRSRVDDYLVLWERSRRLGYGVNHGDIAQGINAVAVPICNQEGEAFASLTHAGPDTMLPPSRFPGLVPAMRRRAIQIAEIAAKMQPDLYACASASTGDSKG